MLGHWAAHKTMGIISAGVALVLAVTVAWLLNSPPTADCSAEAPPNHRIRAAKVVVRPWLGGHHVYASFMVPTRYTPRTKYEVTMVVRGFDHAFVVRGGPDEQYADDVFAGPGYYLLHGYLPTRVALWFLVHARFGDLQDPCSWTLVFIDQSP